MTQVSNLSGRIRWQEVADLSGHVRRGFGCFGGLDLAFDFDVVAVDNSRFPTSEMFLGPAAPALLALRRGLFLHAGHGKPAIRKGGKPCVTTRLSL
jgi:hypothetical protein